MDLITGAEIGDIETRLDNLAARLAPLDPPTATLVIADLDTETVEQLIADAMRLAEQVHEMRIRWTRLQRVFERQAPP